MFRKLMQYVYFLLGMATGAGIALLLAPASGRETRAKISDVANKGLGQLQSEMQTMVDSTQKSLGQMQTELKGVTSQPESAEAEVSQEEAAADSGKAKAKPKASA